MASPDKSEPKTLVKRDYEDINLVLRGLDGDEDALLKIMLGGGKPGIVVEQMDPEKTIADPGAKVERVH